MIELDIKIRVKDQDTVKLFTDLMMKGLTVANQMGQVDVTLSAEKDGDTIILIRKEIIKENALAKLKEQRFTPIDEFIEKSNLPIRIKNILDGTIGYLIERKFMQEDATKDPPFKYAEDITKINFLRCRNAGKKSWIILEEELKRQKINTKMKRTSIYFYECEHQGDLDEYLSDLRDAGAKILSQQINYDAETSMIEIEYPDSFIEAFKKTRAYGFSNLMN